MGLLILSLLIGSTSYCFMIDHDVTVWVEIYPIDCAIKSVSQNFVAFILFYSFLITTHQCRSDLFTKSFPFDLSCGFIILFCAFAKQKHKWRSPSWRSYATKCIQSHFNIQSMRKRGTYYIQLQHSRQTHVCGHIYVQEEWRNNSLKSAVHFIWRFVCE